MSEPILREDLNRLDCEGLGCRKAACQTFLIFSKGKQVNIPVLDSSCLRASHWDVFVATQENLKPGGKGGGRDFFSV